MQVLSKEMAQNDVVFNASGGYMRTHCWAMGKEEGTGQCLQESGEEDKGNSDQAQLSRREQW